MQFHERILSEYYDTREIKRLFSISKIEIHFVLIQIIFLGIFPKDSLRNLSEEKKNFGKINNLSRYVKSFLRNSNFGNEIFHVQRTNIATHHFVFHEIRKDTSNEKIPAKTHPA